MFTITLRVSSTQSIFSGNLPVETIRLMHSIEWGYFIHVKDRAIIRGSLLTQDSVGEPFTFKK
ncbi:protein of unknown function [Legionella micdadei]|uniref:Uncharacterized protein n=1 Tax=Legionella micdadei TaxID=451 RepID=A0A098GGS9_LEGMI|nr:protein of unknown function [Legionella micdadei]